MTVSSLSARNEALLRHVLAVGGPTSPGTLEQVLQVSRPTINRALRDLVAAGFLDKQGDGRSTRYSASDAARIALGASTSSSPGSTIRTSPTSCLSKYRLRSTPPG